MIKIGNNTVTMPPGTVKVCVGDIKVWPPYDDDLIIITRNDYAIGWTNADTDEVEVGYRRKALPEGYTECLYNTIAGGGTFSTGWYTNGTSIIQAKIYKESAPSQAFYLWYSTTATSGANKRLYFTCGASSGTCRFGSGTQAVTTTDIIGKEITIRQDITGIYLDESLYAAYSNPTVDTSADYLRFGSSTNANSSVRFYYFFHIRDGALKSYYVPCIRNSDNQSGFYNIVKDAFLAGGTAGPIKHQ